MVSNIPLFQHSFFKKTAQKISFKRNESMNYRYFRN